jgi:two-component system, chemotaxis family, response regulator Rcp1
MNRPRVLLVEDNPADAEIILETLRAGARPVEITLANDGQRALDILHRSGEAGYPLAPNLVILDLNLPKRCGRDVLGEIRAHDRLRHIPVVVLTSSANEPEIAQLYAAGANCYLVKPLNYGEFVSVLNAIAEFWLSAARLPR